MKKYLLISTVVVGVVAFASGALAQGAATGANGNGTPSSHLSPQSGSAQTCPGGTDGECAGNMVCDTSVKPFVCVASDTAASGTGNVGAGGACASDGQCSGNLACIHNVCQIDPSLEDPGTAGAGGSCNPSNGNNDCSGDQTCVANASGTGGTCQGATGTPTSGSTGGGSGFQALAPIPGLTDQQPSNSLAPFLNNLYKFLIGIAAALAILQIIRGGLNIATQDSAEKHGAGREQITQALIGLALVLSPVLIFSIINPGILNLDINMQSLHLSQYKGADFSGTSAPLPTDSVGNPQSVVPTLPFGPQQGNQFACNGNDCSAAKAKCATFYGSNYVGTWDLENKCYKPGAKTSDPTGVADSGGWLGLSSFSCKAGYNQMIDCSAQNTNQVTCPNGPGTC